MARRDPGSASTTKDYRAVTEIAMNERRNQLVDERVRRWRSQAEQDRVRQALRRAHRAERRLAAARRASVAAHDALAQAAVQAQLAHVGS